MQRQAPLAYFYACAGHYLASGPCTWSEMIRCSVLHGRVDSHETLTGQVTDGLAGF